MFVNRTMRAAQVMLPGEYDDYGEKSEYTVSGSCNAVIMLYTQSRTDDARYKDVTHFCFSDVPLSDDMILIQDSRAYKVELVNNGARRYTSYLREKTELERGNTYADLNGLTHEELSKGAVKWPQTQ